MYDIFKASAEGLKLSQEFEKDCWVRVACPTMEELEVLSKRLSVPMPFLTDALDVDERARVEVDENVTLIILRIPYFDPENLTTPYQTMPLGIVFAPDYVITVCNRQIENFLEFVNGKVKSFSAEHRGRFLLQIFLRTAISYLNHLKDINKLTTAVEYELHQSLKNEELIKLLNLEKCLVYFTTSLRSNEIMMERLEKTGILSGNPDYRDILDDVLVENKQAIEMANIYSNILSGMMDAFASVINNNVSMVMKLLTAITIIFMIPTFVSSTFGMNVPLPFQNWPHAFLIVTSISLLLSLTGVYIFMKRRWF